MKIKSKIIVLFLAITLLVFTPLIFIMQTSVKDENRKQIETQVFDLVESKSNEIDLWINQRISEIKMLMQFEALETMDLGDIRNLVERINHSDTISKKGPDETFAIGKTDGLGYVSYDQYIDVSERDYFLEVLKNEKEYVISEPVLSHQDQEPIFLLSFPIHNKSNDVVGFINGAVSLKHITKIASDINILESTSWIMSTNNEIYSLEENKLLDNTLSEDILNDINQVFNSNKHGKMKVNDQSMESATLFYHDIPNADNWILCTMIYDSTINAQTNSITLIIIKISIIFLLIFIILGIILAKSIVKPINTLKDNMEEVSKGNLNAYTMITRNDEISQLGLYFNKMLDDLKDLLNKVKDSEKQKRTAELKSLQSQINPHFLYNTLDTLQWKALEENNEYVADMINMLSGYFRIVLSDGNDLIKLEDEVNHVIYYLKIQEIRYDEILSYSISVDESLNHEFLPKLMIQPLVENSIYHGLKLKREKGLIEINIEAVNNYIRISVKDSGKGIHEDTLQKIRLNLLNSIESNHYGLYNINERLKLYYKDDYHLEINSIYNEYTEVIITIPKRNGDIECLEY